MATRHTVKLDQVGEGLAFLNIRVEGPLDGTSAKAVAQQVSARIDSLEGRPFGLLFDLRSVTACDEAGGEAMQAIELSAAGKGLEKIAHLVAQKRLVEQANAALEEAGGEKLIGTFDEEPDARRFASGLPP